MAFVTFVVKRLIAQRDSDGAAPTPGGYSLG